MGAPLIVHTHFHHRRSGASRHVEDMVRAQANAVVVGSAVDPALPRLSLREIFRRAAMEEVVWHAHRNNELVVGLLLRALRPRVRVVFTRHAGAEPGGYTRLIASRADRVVTLTPAGARAIRLPAEVVGHGVDVSRFTPAEDRAAAWAALGLEGERGIGVVGRIRPDKGQGDLVEAIEPLLRRHPGWRTVFVGMATARHRGFADALAHKLGDRLSIVPEQPEIVRWYRGLTVLVHPSYTEGYSLVLIEAMASGCCVVATRLPYTEGLVEDGQNGFLYAPGDVAALRRILEGLLADPAKAERIGRRAAEDARRRLGAELEARRLEEIYASVTGRTGLRSTL